jgi:DNA-directed RNA polymerase specialized sigma24 family protein
MVDGELPPAPTRRPPHDSLAEFLEGDYRRLVVGLALVAGSRAAAEDAVQEALARAWERAQRGEQISSLSGYVAVAAINLLRSGFRRLLVERRARQRLREGLHQTPTRPEAYLATADLRVDLSIQDIALALGTRPDTAKGLLHRGRRSLQRLLGPGYQEGVDDAG